MSLNTNVKLEKNIVKNLLENTFITKLSVVNNYKRVAFTLAEVLITLLIIGIVASMIIPRAYSRYAASRT